MKKTQQDAVMKVDRIVHRDIENALPDDLTRKLSLNAIAWYKVVYGDRTDKEYALCVEVQGKDLWCFVRRHGSDEWKVLILPDKEAQEYMKDWDDDFPQTDPEATWRRCAATCRCVLEKPTATENLKVYARATRSRTRRTSPSARSTTPIMRSSAQRCSTSSSR